MPSTAIPIPPTAKSLSAFSLKLQSDRLLESPFTLTGTCRSSVVPSPSWPTSFAPQHFTPPAFVNAHVLLEPGEIAATPVCRPLTSTGVRRIIVVPSPSSPQAFEPQHFTPPDWVTAQLCAGPAAIATTPLVKPVTSAGVLRSILVPSPNWPAKLKPQHLTPPACVSAHEWR